MLQRFVVFVGCLLVFSTAAIAGENKPAQREDLQGTWQILTLEGNGEKKRAEEVQELKIVIKGDELWLVRPTGADPKLKFTLDPTKKTIDLTVQEGKDKGKVVLGIFSLQKGQFQLCINIFGESSSRPSEFRTQEGDGVAFATLERASDK